MTETKHTLGPWQADFDDQNGRCRAIYEDRGVFPVCCFDPLLNPEYSAASGRLIAAAPELLAVVDLLVSVADKDPFISVGLFVEHLADVRAAITKAAGSGS